ncbi:MAG: NAD-dependent epimerase/dehydratase family protein [Terracidiphilus sp.]
MATITRTETRLQKTRPAEKTGITNVLITGARGFLGRNLAAHLNERKGYRLSIASKEESIESLRRMLIEADIIFHLAGVNRPADSSDFARVNTGLTEQICNVLDQNGRAPKIIFSSSVQAALDNPYGVSKRNAEEALLAYARKTGACVRIYRLSNLFGKWCRPGYNSVTATFCHHIANDLPIEISDPARAIELSYVDDVVRAFVTEIAEDCSEASAVPEIPAYSIQLGDLAGRIQAFHDFRATLTLPDFAEPFNRALYATYLSYVPPAAREHKLAKHTDARGSLAEFIKQQHMGQVFVSRTKPGITRGNHYHHTKAEKFLVVEGKGLIRMRPVEGGPIEEYPVVGSDFHVINIPPGYTHSITNIGSGDMVTLFWSSEIFDPNNPDTYFLPVDA